MRALWLALVFLLAPASASALTVGVVNMERAMFATKHYQQVKGRLEKEQSKRQAVLDEKQAVLQRRKEELDAQLAVSTPEALRPQQEALIAETQALAQQFQGLQAELMQIEQKYTGQLLVRFQAVVRQLAVQKDLDYVFEGGNGESPNVLFARPPLDLTDEVVELYRKNYGDKPLELD